MPSQDGQGELIFYERPDTTGPKLSRFTITPTDDPDGLEVSAGGSCRTGCPGVLGAPHHGAEWGTRHPRPGQDLTGGLCRRLCHLAHPGAAAATAQRGCWLQAAPLLVHRRCWGRRWACWVW